MLVERFGSYVGLRGPGLNWAGFDCGGACVSLKGISSRVQQLKLSVNTKTKDNVFITLVVAVQLSVVPDRVNDAVYKLGNVQQQVDSHVSDVLRAHVPKMDLDDIFEQKDELSQEVLSKLGQFMAAYGWDIHNALVTELLLSGDVQRAMTEVNKQARLKESSEMKAEAQKILTVKAAEAEADRAHLEGMGIARNRDAILTGLKQSLAENPNMAEDVSSDTLMQLLLTAQHFDTLKTIGSLPTAKAYFIPDDYATNPDTQVQLALLEAEAVAPMLPRKKDKHKHTSHRPAQQSMHGGSRTPALLPPAAQQMSSDSFMQTSPTTNTFSVRIPDGAAPGSVLTVRAPNGTSMQVTVPPYAAPGSTIQVQQPPASLARSSSQSGSERRTMTVQLPGNAYPGAEMSVKAPNGSTVKVRIPEGYGPGSTMQVAY